MRGSKGLVRARVLAGLGAFALVAAACGGGGDDDTADTVSLEEVEPIVDIDPCDLIDEDTASTLSGADVEAAESTTEDDGTATCDFAFADADVADQTGSAIAASLSIGPGDDDDVPTGAAVARSLSLGDRGAVEDDEEKVRVVYIVQQVVVRVEVVPGDGEVDEELIDAVVEFTETTEAPVTEAVTGEPFVPTTEAPTTTEFVDEEVPEGEAIEVDGDTETLVVERAGGEDNRVFEGEEGDIIFVEATTTARTPVDSTDCMTISIIDPSDFSVGSVCAQDDGSSFIDRVELAVDGAYQVVLDPGANVTGSVDVTITSATDEEGEVEVDGNDAILTVRQPGGVARFTFEADAGDAIFVNIPAAFREPSELTDCLTVSILDPNDFSIGSACAQIDGSAFIDRIDIQESGTHTLQFDPGGRTIGSVTVQITSAD